MILHQTNHSRSQILHPTASFFETIHRSAFFEHDRLNLWHITDLKVNFPSKSFQNAVYICPCNSSLTSTSPNRLVFGDHV